MAGKQRSRRRSGRRKPGRGSGRRPLVPWLLFLLLAAGALVLGSLEERVAESGFRRIQTNRLRLDPRGTWTDPRWERELAFQLAGTGPLDAADVEGRSALVASIEALSFVAEVGRAEVLWPDGLRVPVRFQNPVACVFVGDGYLPVADDGTVISGLRDAPPQLGGGWLPVVGSHAAEPFDLAPGDVIADQALLDAIDIAVSMWVHLPERDLATLGRVRIDAERAHRASPTEPGARLYLEGGRELWFGRAPRAGEPGSQPVEAKWAHVSRALDLLRTGLERADWRMVDVRWDRAEMRLFDDGDSE